MVINLQYTMLRHLFDNASPTIIIIMGYYLKDSLPIKQGLLRTVASKALERDPSWALILDPNTISFSPVIAPFLNVKCCVESYFAES